MPTFQYILHLFKHVNTLHIVYDMYKYSYASIKATFLKLIYQILTLTSFFLTSAVRYMIIFHFQ